MGKDNTKQEVLTMIRKFLILIFGTYLDMLNAWFWNERMMKILMLVVLSNVGCGRKDIGKKVMKKNKDNRIGP